MFTLSNNENQKKEKDFLYKVRSEKAQDWNEGITLNQIAFSEFVLILNGITYARLINKL